MPGTGTTPHQTDTPGGYFTSAFLDMQSYFDIQSGDIKSQPGIRSPRLTPPSTSPVLNPLGRPSPSLWGNIANSPGLADFQPFAVALPRIDTQVSPVSPSGIAPHQTTTLGSNIVHGNPSPPSSSESSPQKLLPAGNISPLDSFIVGLPEARTVNGQVTPPDDILQSPAIAPLPGPSFPFTYPQHSKSSTATPRNSESISPRQQPAQVCESVRTRRQSTSVKRRRSSAEQSGSKRSRKNSVAASDEPPEKQEAKRKKFLERNRVAASKCRQKKKAWMQELESDAREAQTNSKHLKMAVTLLREEILRLKNELLKHNTCDCTPIRQYLSQEAAKLVTTTSIPGMHAGDRRPTASDCSAVSDEDMKIDSGDFDLDLVGSPEDTTT